MKFLGTRLSNLAIDSPKHIASAVQSSVVLSLFSNHPREHVWRFSFLLQNLLQHSGVHVLFPTKLPIVGLLNLGPEHFLLYLLFIRADYFFCNTIVTEERESYGGV
jgi:hypothetical protein